MPVAADHIHAFLVHKALSALDRPTQARIAAGIQGIPQGDIKTLQGYTDGRHRLRIGKYRIIFSIIGEDLHIMDIGSRGDIYK